MTKTKNYDLNQWDGGDRILRTDFNADNAAIEAALTAHAEDVQNLYDTRLCIISGSYVGDGVTNRVIDLGREVSVIFIYRKDVYPNLDGFFAILPTSGTRYRGGNANVDLLLHTGTGFQILSATHFYREDTTYYYIALATGA